MRAADERGSRFGFVCGDDASVWVCVCERGMGMMKEWVRVFSERLVCT